MKKLFASATLLTILITTPVLLENASADPAPTPVPPQQNFQPGSGANANFAQRKTMILQKMASRQACVQAATNEEALRACKPEHAPKQ